jgi:hypothetical protein
MENTRFKIKMIQNSLKVGVGSSKIIDIFQLEINKEMRAFSFSRLGKSYNLKPLFKIIN